MPDDPYCGNCGYSFVGLTESARCPECGEPIVEVLQRKSLRPVGRRYTSKSRAFGLPLVHIAFGPDGDEPHGKARGIIALGDDALGWIAFGGIARGFIAGGGMAFGLITMGGLALGLLAGLGGMASGAIAFGGGALGIVPAGGGAVGYIATGGGAVGVYAHGGGAAGRYVVSPTRRDPEAIAMFEQLDQVFGTNPTQSTWPIVVVGGYLAAIVVLIALMAVLVAIGQRFTGDEQEEFR